LYNIILEKVFPVTEIVSERKHLWRCITTYSKANVVLMVRMHVLRPHVRKPRNYAVNFTVESQWTTSAMTQRHFSWSCGQLIRHDVADIVHKVL